MFGMAEHVRSESLLISMLVAMVVDRLAIDSLQVVLASTDLPARELPAQWVSGDVSYRISFRRALRTEEALRLATFAQVLKRLVLECLSEGRRRPGQCAQERLVQLRLLVHQRLKARPADLVGRDGSVKRLGERVVRPAEVECVVPRQLAGAEEAQGAFAAVLGEQIHAYITGNHIEQPLRRVCLVEEEFIRGKAALCHPAG